MTDAGYGDPVHQPVWEAARRGVLLIQRCGCGHAQLPARPFCLSCEGTDLTWIEAGGSATVHSVTTVHVRAHDVLDPPYDVALVDLEEGPRLLTTIAEAASGTTAIGDAVTVTWQERPDAPPLPVFRPVG